MDRRPIAIATAVLVFLLPAAPESATAPTPPPLSAEAARRAAGARTLIRDRRFDEALEILRPLARGESVDANVLFLYGLAAIEAAQKPGRSEDARPPAGRGDLRLPHHAGRAAASGARPSRARPRLFLKGEDELARRHFEQVLAGKPPPAVALNVNRFLNIMRARKRWSLRLGMALAPDSNIGAGSDERVIYIHGLPYRRNQDELTSSGVGISVWLGGEYQYPLGDSGTGSGVSSWRLRAGGDVSRKEYRASRVDQLSVSSHVGPHWLIGRTSEASLPLSGLHHWSGSGLEEPSHHDIGVRVEGRHRFNRGRR